VAAPVVTSEQDAPQSPHHGPTFRQTVKLAPWQALAGRADHEHWEEDGHDESPSSGRSPRGTTTKKGRHDSEDYLASCRSSHLILHKRWGGGPGSDRHLVQRDQPQTPAATA